MKLNIDGAVTVTLSKRNILALLYKIDNPESLGRLVKLTDNGLLVVQAEPDAAHYAGEPYGPMSADTEEFIKQHETAQVPGQQQLPV